MYFHNDRTPKMLTALGALVVIIGILVKVTPIIHIGSLLFGGTLLYFNVEMTTEFVTLYKTTNKTFVRIMVIAGGLIFVLSGLYGVLQFGL
jgi:hypothetical protein